MKLDTSKVKFSGFDKKFKVRLPSDLDLILSEDLGIQIGDGSITRCYGKINETPVLHNFVGVYVSLSEDKDYALDHIVKLKETLFNKKWRISENKKKNTLNMVVMSNAILSFYTDVCGLPIGKKSDIGIPDMIKNSNKDIKAAFLRGLFDTDGSLSFKKDKTANPNKIHDYPVISLCTISKRLMDDLGELLTEFGFKPYIRYNIEVQNRNNSISIENRLDINGKKNFRIWMENIGFSNPKFLTKVDVWKKLGYCPPNTNIKQRLEILKNKWARWDSDS